MSAPSFDSLKVPPHSITDERSVLGGLMAAGRCGDGSAWVAVSGLLTAEDFYSEVHRTIFKAMRDLAFKQMPIDITTVETWLRERGDLDDVGGFVFLAQLTANAVGYANVTAYAKTVRNTAMLRRVIAVGTDLIEKAYKSTSAEDDVQEVVEGGVAAMFRLEQDNTAGDANLKIIRPFLKSTLAEKEELIRAYHAGEKTLKGIPTGIEVLDQRWSGMEKGRVYTIAATTSVGKSAEALQITDFVAQFFAEESKYFVAVFSLEMPEHELVDRLIACSGRADYGKLREPWKLDSEAGDWMAVSRGVKQLGGTDLFMDCSSTLKVSNMRQRVRRTAAETRKKPGLIVLDHLQLMSGESKSYVNRVAEMSEITRDVKRLAKDLDVPIIQLSQLSRAVESRTNKRPTLADLRESGTIEQDSDVVQFIYRESKYDPDCGHNDVEFITAKARFAQLGTDLAVWIGHHQRFENRVSDYAGGSRW